MESIHDDSQGQAKHFEPRFVKQAVTDWKTWLQLFTFLGINIPVYAVALFLPSVIADLGFSAANAQLLSVPPFICGCLCTVIMGIYSDKIRMRGPFVVGGATISLIGYIIAYTTTAPGPGYAAAVIAAMGVYPCIPLIVTWAGSNAGGDVKRGVVIAMVVCTGNLGG